MPRFQFTIRGMLWATFWAAVSMASWAVWFRSERPSSEMFAFVFLGIVSPALAIAPLVSRNKLAICVAIEIWVVLALIASKFLTEAGI